MRRYGFFLLILLFSYIMPAYPAAVEQSYRRKRQNAVVPQEQTQNPPPETQQKPAPQAGQKSAPAIPQPPEEPLAKPIPDYSSLNMKKEAAQVNLPLSEAEEDLQRVVNSLKTSGQLWRRITSPQVKEMAVYYFITEYKEKGIKIKQPAAHYVGLIDDMSAQSPELLAKPFEEILSIVAIIEYDFDNGQNKDELARRVLGEDGFIRNKERLGIP